jgi:hypothetical protein
MIGCLVEAPLAMVAQRPENLRCASANDGFRPARPTCWRASHKRSRAFGKALDGKPRHPWFAIPTNFEMLRAAELSLLAWLCSCRYGLSNFAGPQLCSAARAKCF